jgi:hypothetical protein
MQYQKFLLTIIFPIFLFGSHPFDKTLMNPKIECPFYTIPDLPEIHYFYDVYRPWPYED